MKRRDFLKISVGGVALLLADPTYRPSEVGIHPGPAPPGLSVGGVDAGPVVAWALRAHFDDGAVTEHMLPVALVEPDGRVLLDFVTTFSRLLTAVSFHAVHASGFRSASTLSRLPYPKALITGQNVRLMFHVPTHGTA